MTFGQIFWPVFAALLSSFTITEIFHFSLGYYLHKRQEAERKELEAKVARGEIDPRSIMFGDFAPSEMDFPLSTSSGEKSNGSQISHGQYL